MATSAGWFALAFLGQWTALQLIDAGNSLRYQHYRLERATLASDAWLWGVVLVELLLVAVALGRLCRGHAARIGPATAIRLAIAVLALWSTSAIVSRTVWKYPLELTVAATIELLALSAVAFGVAALPAVGGFFSQWGRALADSRDRLPRPGGRRLIVAGALLVGAVTAALGIFVYQRHPHVPDEVVYLLHARYFAEGRLTLPLPPALQAFDLDLMYYDATRWFSPVPPGWPAILAAGAFVGVPWLVNPVLSALNIWLAWKLLSRIYPGAVGGLATLLLCVSPWHLFLGMSYMTHTATLTCALLGAVGMANAHQTRSSRWLVVSGVGVGLVSLIRPLEGLAVAMVLAPLSLGAGARRIDLRSGMVFSAAFVLTAALVLPYNFLLTGDPFTFPIMAYADKYYWPNANALGFGPDRGLGWAIDPRPGHTPLEAVVNTLINMSQVNTELLGWASGSTVAVLALLVGGRLSRVDWVMVATIAVIIGLHAFYWYTGGPDFGARYWFLIIVPMLALSARGIQELERQVAARAPEHAGRVVLATALLSAFALASFLPWRAVDKYWHFRNMRPDVRELAERHGFGRSLVFIRGNRFDDYASAAVYNPVDVRSAEGPVYAWDRDEATVLEALRAFPDRPVWVLEGPSLTGRGFEIASRPGAALRDH